MTQQGKFHPDAFVPVGNIVKVSGEDTGSIDVSDVEGVLFQCRGSANVTFDFVEAVTSLDEGLTLEAGLPVQLLWFGRDVQTIYYYAAATSELYYQLVKHAGGN